MRIHIALSDPEDPHAVRSVDFTRDDSSLLAGRHSEDDSPRLGVMKLSSKEWVESFDWALAGAATCVRYCDAERRIVFIDERYGAHAISSDANDIDIPTKLADHVNQLSAARDKALVGISGTDAQILDVASNQTVWSADSIGLPPQSSVALNRHGAVAAAAPQEKGAVKFFEIGSSRLIRSIDSPLDGIDRLSLCDRGRWIAAIGRGYNGCAVWNTNTGQAAGEIFCNPGQNNNTAQALHPNRDLVAYGTIVGYVVLVDLQRNEIAYMEKLHNTRIWDLRFSANDNLLAAAGDDGAITVIDLDEMLSIGMSRMNT